MNNEMKIHHKPLTLSAADTTLISGNFSAEGLVSCASAALLAYPSLNRGTDARKAVSALLRLMLADGRTVTLSFSEAYSLFVWAISSKKRGNPVLTHNAAGQLLGISPFY